MDFESVYEQIKRDYFPGWDLDNEWQLRFSDDLYGAQSVCNAEAKTITLVRNFFMYPGAPGINHLKVVLIHEISHAITRGFHEVEWIEQMQKASYMAERLGDTELKGLIREEVHRYIVRKKKPPCFER